MRKILPIIVLLIITINLGAQRRDTTKVDFDRNILSATNVKRAGLVISATGLTLFSIGLLRLATSPSECDPDSPGGLQNCHFTEIHGTGLMLAGAITMGVGIPVWTFSKQKERYGRIILFSSVLPTPVNGIGLKIDF